MKILKMLSLTLIFSNAIYAVKIGNSDSTDSKTVMPKKNIIVKKTDIKEKPVIEPGWKQWASDKRYGVENNVLWELENNQLDARAKGNQKRLQNAIQKCLKSGKDEALAKIYMLAKKQNIQLDIELNQEAYVTLKQYQEKQDQEFFDDMVIQLTALHEYLTQTIQTIESSVTKHIKKIQNTGKGLQATHYYQGVQPRWPDKKIQIIKRLGLITSLATIKTLKKELNNL